MYCKEKAEKVREEMIFGRSIGVIYGRQLVPDGIGLHVGPRCCEVSSDKVLILNNSRRRPLMIDAQIQAQSFRIDLECTLW